jgi:Domain of unknown function (DUF4105)
MVEGESEIDDKNFFFAVDGKTNAKSELEATIKALLNEQRFDDNSSACRFPARKIWLKEKLEIKNFPEVVCKEYDETLERLAPKSATLVFPAAHINSPASMFGHTFLRINSKYKSRLLAYAINYAANADPDKENATVFALKGLFGGYYGKYSLLPYYEKLKEYRDAEQRDIWEYDLNLSEEEVRQMVRHIWELNGTHSDYYFFTENCSYNMLWFIEVARPSIHLREYFSYQVIPLESIHATNEEGVISTQNYRPSKRTILLKYEELIEKENISYVKELVSSEIQSETLLAKKEISLQQKMYLFEAAIEYLEYSYGKNTMSKEKYLELFHLFTKSRATLGFGAELSIEVPANPINSHRAIRTTAGFGYRDGSSIGFLGLRPAYHDLEDSNYGFLRGTEIEFLDILLSYNDKSELEVENATLLSIASLAQRSEFFDSLSWRVNLGWDNDSLDEKASFTTSVGAGYSFGNEFAYTYMMLDPLFYLWDGFVGGVGGSIGVVIDKFDFMSTNLELTKRYYDGGREQALVEFTQSFRTSKNSQIQLKYTYKDKELESKKVDEQTFRVMLNYYF